MDNQFGCKGENCFYCGKTGQCQEDLSRNQEVAKMNDIVEKNCNENKCRKLCAILGCGVCERYALYDAGYRNAKELLERIIAASESLGGSISTRMLRLWQMEYDLIPIDLNGWKNLEGLGDDKKDGE